MLIICNKFSCAVDDDCERFCRRRRQVKCVSLVQCRSYNAAFAIGRFCAKFPFHSHMCEHIPKQPSHIAEYIIIVASL